MRNNIQRGSARKGKVAMVLKWMAENKLRTAASMAVIVCMMVLQCFAFVKYYEPLSTSVDVMSKVLDETASRDEQALGTLSGRAGELKSAEAMIKSYLWEFLLIFTSATIASACIIYSILLKRVKIGYLLRSCLAFITVFFMLFFAFGLVLGLKRTVLISTIMPEHSFISTAVFACLCFLGLFLAEIAAISMKEWHGISENAFIYWEMLSRGLFKLLAAYAVMNAIILLFAGLFMAALFLTESIGLFFISLAGMLVALPFLITLSRIMLVKITGISCKSA